MSEKLQKLKEAAELDESADRNCQSLVNASTLLSLIELGEAVERDAILGASMPFHSFMAYKGAVSRGLLDPPPVKPPEVKELSL